MITGQRRPMPAPNPPTRGPGMVGAAGAPKVIVIGCNSHLPGRGRSTHGEVVVVASTDLPLRVNGGRGAGMVGAAGRCIRRGICCQQMMSFPDAIAPTPAGGVVMIDAGMVGALNPLRPRRIGAL